MGGRLPTARRNLRGDGRALRLLDLTEFYSPRGGGVRVYLSAKAAWCAGRPDVHHAIVAPGARDATTDFAGSPLHTIAGPRAPGASGYHVLLRTSALREVVRQEQPDLVELGSIYLAPWLLRRALRDRPIPTVGLFHMDLAGAALRSLPSWSPTLLRHGVARSLSAYLRATYAHCRIVIGTSEPAMAAMHAAGLRRTTLVPFGVDTTLFHPGRRDSSWRTEIGARDTRPTVLYVGRLAGEKNVAALIRALPELRRRADATLVCIGDGPLRPRLEQLATRYDQHLIVLPFEPDRERLARAYASADVVVAPCEHETFGLAVLEAAASGTPVAGAAAGAVGVQLDGQSWGRTFGPHDADGLVRAVTELVDGDRAVLGAAARAVADGYSWDRTFTELMEVYRAVLG